MLDVKKDTVMLTEHFIQVGNVNLSLQLQQYLEKHKADFQQTLIPDLSYLHESAVSDANICIHAVTHRQGQVYTLKYTYPWVAYNGCLGLDEKGTVQGSIDFTLSNKGLVTFDLSIF